MNDIRKERTKALYINIVCDLIRTKGMQAVTIRTISDLAGYNSATLYSYFDNLPQLILYAQMQFENELGSFFQEAIRKEHIEKYYDIWPHMYGIMAEYYLNNPNIFECAFISDYAGSQTQEIRNMREEKSSFHEYVEECIMRISAETSTNPEKIFRINGICLAHVTGMVLLFARGRLAMKTQFDRESFEAELKQIIRCFMEEAE